MGGLTRIVDRRSLDKYHQYSDTLGMRTAMTRADSQARTRVELETLLDATRPAGTATTKPVSRPSDARADGQGG